MTDQRTIVPTTIMIDPAVRQRLKTFGTHGMTYNDILTRMMDDIQRREFIGEMRRIAEGTPTEQWIDIEELDEPGLPRSPSSGKRGGPAKSTSPRKARAARGASRRGA